MWTCPKCKQKLVNRGQWHSCGQSTVAQFIEGKSTLSVSLFHHFIDTYRQVGNFELHPAKTRIALVGQMRFCAINRLGRDFLDGHLVLRERHDNKSCFYKIDQFGDRDFVHHFRLYSKDDLTTDLLEFMKKAYEVGQRN